MTRRVARITPEARHSVVVRRDGQADVGEPLRAVGKELFRASVAQPVELAQHEAGEELGEREVAACERAEPIREHFAAQPVRRANHLPWRLTGLHPAWDSDATQVALPNARRTGEG